MTVLLKVDGLEDAHRRAQRDLLQGAQRVGVDLFQLSGEILDVGDDLARNGIELYLAQPEMMSSSWPAMLVVCVTRSSITPSSVPNAETSSACKSAMEMLSRAVFNRPNILCRRRHGGRSMESTAFSTALRGSFMVSTSVCLKSAPRAKSLVDGIERRAYLVADGGQIELLDERLDLLEEPENVGLPEPSASSCCPSARPCSKTLNRSTNSCGSRDSIAWLIRSSGARKYRLPPRPGW